ncbi:RnfABCDGE type electron transport complex subunit D [Tahibacter amnicola]|uniref:Ion-translocating oxidoreductase complex subunit D n=1 Tax=Tahibacter amnicola TaxID=2976241 RepID=A0ABY6BB32_9GAMM|nr:RnfABCDGE type electron transport complex subunit D [Tahibacter amnicola]UXI67266.1 RnfABCDGE type electron transport complex subunit D [Tahibacter amnicola]
MRTFPVHGGPHLSPPRHVRHVMVDVLLALVPGIAAHVWFFGVGVLVQLILAAGFAIAIEAVALRWRGLPVRRIGGDPSVLVTAALFALCLPPLAPWWISLAGMLAAVVLARHAYGGMGYNLFNPAMVGYAVVLISFPREVSGWIAAGTQALDPLDVIRTILAGDLPAPLRWDTISSATPLDTVKSLAARGHMIGEIRHDPQFGDFGGRGWEWIANAYALGGLYLLWRGVIRWQVPVAVIGSVIAVSAPLWLLDADVHPMPLQHVFSGGLMLAAWFIATDPVTGCASPRGRLLFGIGVGVLTLVIRRWGSYPDGVAFAVLLMNGAAPLIDRYTRPRVFGTGSHA